MNILITGGLGYIGSHIISGLLSKKYKITVIDNLSNSKISTLDKLKKINPKKISFFKIDVTNKEKVNNLFKKKKIDLVLHLAGLKSVEESTKKPKTYYKNNVLGTINILEAMKNNKVNKIIFSSSATVYGIPKTLPINENSKVKPINYYGVTKKIIEDLIILENKTNQLNYIILRYFNPGGAHKSGLIGEEPLGTPNNLFPYIGKIIMKKKKFLRIFGNNYKTKDGTGARDYIHIDDLVDAHLSSIKLLNKKKSEIINIGSGKYYTVLEIVNEFKKSCDIKINYIFYPRRKGDAEILYNDINKAKKILNWKPKKNLSQICKSLNNFYKSL